MQTETQTQIETQAQRHVGAHAHAHAHVRAHTRAHAHTHAHTHEHDLPLSHHSVHRHILAPESSRSKEVVVAVNYMGAALSKRQKTIHREDDDVDDTHDEDEDEGGYCHKCKDNSGMRGSIASNVSTVHKIFWADFLV